MPEWYAKQVGPLPMGAWVGVLAGGLGLAYFINKGQVGKFKAAGAEADVSTGTPSGVAEGPGPGLTPISTAPIPVGPVTNEEWAARAIEELTARGHPLELVEPAINNYIAGRQLTAAEMVYVNIAKALIGNPPLPIPITQPGPTPGPSPGPSPGTGAGIPAKPSIRSRQLNRTAVIISWGPAARATSYEVRRIRGGTGEPWVSVGSSLTYTGIARPTTKTGFAWEIRARNKAGASAGARTPVYTLG